MPLLHPKTTNPGQPPRAHRWLAGIGLSCVQALLLVQLHQTVDLPMWDESNHMGQGAAFTNDSGTLGALSESPLYNLWYATLTTWYERITAIFVSKYAITLLTTALLFALLTRARRSVVVPSMLTLCWAASSFNLNASVMTYHFALSVFLLALLVCARSRIVATALLVCCALIRLEYGLVCLGYLAYLGLRTVKGSQGWRREARRLSAPLLGAGFALAVLVAVYTASTVSSWDLGGRRSWHAFRQHYALSQVEAGRADVDPWIDYAPLIVLDFGDSHSTMEALLSNPSAMARHVGENMVRLPSAALQLLLPFELRSRWIVYGTAAALLLAPVIVAASTSTRRRRYAAALGALAGALVRHPGTPFRGAIQEHRKDSADLDARVGTNLQAVVLGETGKLSALGTLALLPSLAIRAKASYCLPALPLLLLVANLLLRAAVRVHSNERAKPWAVPFAFLWCAVFSFAAFTAPPSSPFGASRPILSLVTEFDALWPRRPAKLLGVGASSIANYLGPDRCIAFEPLPSVSGAPSPPTPLEMSALLQRFEPDVVWLNPALLRSPNFRAESLDALATPSWVRHPLRSGDVYLRAEPAP